MTIEELIQASSNLAIASSEVFHITKNDLRSPILNSIIKHAMHKAHFGAHVYGSPDRQGWLIVTPTHLGPKSIKQTFIDKDEDRTILGALARGVILQEAVKLVSPRAADRWRTKGQKIPGEAGCRTPLSAEFSEPEDK